MAMPEMPKKVGNSGESVCVRSMTDEKLRCASAGVTAVAAKPAAAPAKKPRRDSARITLPQSGTHMLVSLAKHYRTRRACQSAPRRYERAMLVLNDISVRIAGRLLLDEASARIPDGARVGLVGRNGIGKTTLFRAIVGEMPIEHGSIEMP